MVVSDAWGYECYGSYEDFKAMLFHDGHPVVRHLNYRILWGVPLAHGTKFAWMRGRSLWLADLRRGNARQLATLSTPAVSVRFVVDHGGRSAFLAGDRTLIVVRRDIGDFASRTAQTTDATQASFSADGRRIAFPVEDGVAVQSLRGDKTVVLDGSGPQWSPRGARIARLSAGRLKIRDVSSGREMLDTPLPPNADSGSLSWSPDGRFVVVNGDVSVNVATGRTLAFPRLQSFDDLGRQAWRPRSGHLLLRSEEYGDPFDVVNAATGRRLMHGRSEGMPLWSPDGRWLLRTTGERPAVVGATGVQADLPRSLTSWWSMVYYSSWLGDHSLALGGENTLVLARPPFWSPRVIARVAEGHHLRGEMVLRPTRAGVRFLERTFAPRAEPRDC